MQDCIVGENLYRNTIDCIVTEVGHGLYCNTVTGPRHGVGRCWGMQQAREARSRRRHGEGARMGHARQAAGRAGVQAGGARARGLSGRATTGAAGAPGGREVRAAPALCTRCIRPVFGPV